MVRNTKIRCPKLPELKDLKKSHWITPGSAFTCKYPYGAPQAYKSGGGGRLDFGFLAKNH